LGEKNGREVKKSRQKNLGVCIQNDIGVFKDVQRKGRGKAMKLGKTDGPIG